MNTKKIALLIATILVITSLFVLVSIASAQPRRQNIGSDIQLHSDIHRVIDSELGVACYYREYRDAFHCVTLPQLQFRR